MAILLCFAAVYIKTVIIPQAHLEANFVANQTVRFIIKDSTTGNMWTPVPPWEQENRQLVDFEEIPDNLINATVAIEETRRSGSTTASTGSIPSRVSLLMFTGGDIQGGSTIAAAHQNAAVRRCDGKAEDSRDLYHPWTLTRPIQGADSGWYLNYIYLGEGCYGVAPAAQNYFGKELSGAGSGPSATT